MNNYWLCDQYDSPEVERYNALQAKLYDQAMREQRERRIAEAQEREDSDAIKK